MTLAEMGLSVVVALVGGGHVWNWLSSRGKAKIDLITLGQTISASIIESLREERKELLDKIDALEATVAELRLEVAEWGAHAMNLEDTIRKLGATPPPMPPKRK